MEAAGCSTLAEFRALAPARLFAAWDAVRTQPQFKGMGCEPVVDGRFQVKSGPETLAADEQHHIPYLIGFTSEDIVPPYLYQMAQDWCARNADSYGWFFDRQLPGDDRGAWHSSDLWYWFGTLAHCWRPFTEKDTALSAQMVDYLTNFAGTGNPNGTDLPQWQTVTAQQTDFLRLGEEPTHMGSVDVQKLLWTMQNVPAVGSKPRSNHLKSQKEQYPPLQTCHNTLCSGDIMFSSSNNTQCQWHLPVPSRWAH